MDCRCFVGEDLATAIAEVRRQWGPNAMLLHARSVPCSGWKGLFRRFNRVEVLAAPPQGVAADARTTELHAMLERFWPETHMASADPTPPLVDPHRRMVQSLAVPTVGPPLPIEVRGGRRRVVALVGPTGAGKTTTIAKLAARMHLKHGWRVGLITADTFRVGAVQQLHDYSRLLHLPLEVAGTAAALDRALGRLEDTDVVLVDTSGHGHRNRTATEALHAYLDGAFARSGTATSAREVHLVLAGPTRRQEADAILDAYAGFEPRVLLTKLDECEDVSDVIEAVASRGLRLSYCTFGQNVPDDIALAWPDQLIRGIEPGGRGPDAAQAVGER